MTYPLVVDEVLLRSLREDLVAFTPDSVSALLGPVAAAALGREQALPARRECRRHAGEPVATLTSVFALGDEVSRAALDVALPRLTCAGAIRLGLIEASGQSPADSVRARVDLRPYGVQDAAGAHTWWIASDLGELATGRALAEDHVLGVGGASVMLARSTIRTPVGRVLDLGTGCGVQALHAVRHARGVVATDISARALAFAHFTMALNGVAVREEPGEPGVELRRGNLLEPVAGDTFDLVVSNPPFVITPRRPGVPEYEYRDAGGVGDDVVRRLVTGVGDVLAPGGVAIMLANWEHHRGLAWKDRLESWLDEPAARVLDAWVVQREVLDPAEYAHLWISDGGVPEGAQFDALFEAWLDDFAARGVEAIGLGLMVLRRRRDTWPSRTPTTTPSALSRLEHVSGGGDGPLGDHVAQVLAAADWLDALDDEALLSRRLVVSPDVTQENHYRWPGDGDPAVVLLRQGGGLARVVQVSTEVAAVVGACDGDLTLGQITAAVAVLLDRPVGQIRSEVLPAIRGLTADVLLQPVTPPA